ncbi:MAG: pyrroline-5-carboxylate reductase [Nitrososphaeria archaeon]
MHVGILGLGSLGSAVTKGLLKSGVTPEDIVVFDVEKGKVDSFKNLLIRSAPSIKVLQSNTDILLLCVKPKDFNNVASQLSGVEEDKVLISFVGGLKLEVISSRVQGKGIFRAMPNISCEVCEASIALASLKDVRIEQRMKVEQLLSRLGDVFVVEENVIDAFTSLSGSGVAFASEVIKSFYEAGVLLGLPHNTAKKVALKVFLGTSKLLEEKGFDEILERVATPGGTTIEGIYILERKAVKGSIIEAIKAGADKASLLSS